ncbi:MAG: peptidoglycan DD-metalloendopeptidase family protein [Phyllobacteriaceae bacterium]|nr:peptidoglycan DD-metalloendopeptidase family protein [Phyllobacteriaceae bacterium]
MSAGISLNARRVALRGAAIMVIGGLAAGCSSGVQRFTDAQLFTGSTSNQRQIIKAPSYQPYPGDVGVRATTNPDYSGSVARSAVEPVDLTTGGVERSTLPPVRSVKNKARALAAPAVAAVSAAKDKISARLRPGTTAATESVALATTKAKTAAKAAMQPITAARANVDGVTTGAIEKGKAAVAPVVDKARAVTADTAVKRGWSKAGGTAITLREGETLYNLSRRFGVPVSAIVAANGLKDASSVSAGEKIVIPTYVYSSDVPVSAPDSNPEVAASKSSRGKKEAPTDKAPEKLPAKSEVAVLPATPRPKDKAAAPTASAAKSSADKLAEKAKTVAAKPVKTEAIKPAAVKSATTVAGGYKVQSGDSLWSIAKKTGSTTAALKAANNMDGAALRVGQVLVVPTQSASAAKSANVDPIITGSSKPNKPATVKADAAKTSKTDPLPTYTAPKKTDAAIAEAEKDAAAAPEQTGIGKMRWPARGKVVAGYGAKSAGKSNDGIDISLPAGSPVKAAENGVVIYAGDGLKEFGNTVLVRHEDGLVTVYGHNSNLKVKRGDKVTRGQDIASSGATGDTETPKLHFEVRKNSTPVDPSKYLD